MLQKQIVQTHFLTIIEQKINEVLASIADIKLSAANETKSTAGDKHETALAMLQIEEANKREQLTFLQQQKLALQNINPLLVNNAINKGSLVKTNNGYLFVSVALGKAIIENDIVVALSSQSPLGQCLLGLKVGDNIVFNNTQYLINAIL